MRIRVKSSATPQERILAHVKIDPITGCWVWQASCALNGYSQIGTKDGLYRGHRFSYEAFVGPIPEGMVLDHTCHTSECTVSNKDCPHRKCVNPAHLEPVTEAENIARGNGGRYQREKTHCKRGHLLSGENMYIGTNGARVCSMCRWLRSHTPEEIEKSRVRSADRRRVLREFSQSGSSPQ